MADASDLDLRPPRSTHRDRAKAYAGLLLCVLLWGMVFPGSARLLVRINAVQLVTLRFMLVSLSFVISFSLRPSLIPSLGRRQWLTVLVCGVLAVPGSQLAVVHAQTYLSPPLAALLSDLCSGDRVRARSAVPG